MSSDELHLGKQNELVSVKSGPLMVMAVAVLGLIGLAFVGTQLWQRMNSPGNNGAILVELGPLPQIEPLILQPIPKEVAKQQNDATPFITTTVPAAAPFVFKGSPLDFERAQDCLAATIYYEAANEKPEGQMAVAQVVLNRARHPAYPRTVCGVVFQGHERRTGCQFSYTCDGSMARRTPPEGMMAQFRAMAAAMLNGQVYAPVGTATHYHTDWVRPYWSATLDKIRAEQSHLFFKWTGFWGTPAAFKGVYQGAEPSFAKMGIVSAAHRTHDFNLDDVMRSLMESQEFKGEAGLGAEPSTLPTNETSAAPIAGAILPLPPTLDVTTPGTASPIPQMPTAEERAKDSFLLHAPRSTDPATLMTMATGLCGTRAYCKVMIWADKSAVPKALPMDDTARAKLAFSYLRNQEQGFEKPLWNCDIFARLDRKQCMRR
jgi:hypothetical protein